MEHIARAIYSHGHVAELGKISKTMCYMRWHCLCAASLNIPAAIGMATPNGIQCISKALASAQLQDDLGSSSWHWLLMNLFDSFRESLEAVVAAGFDIEGAYGRTMLEETMRLWANYAGRDDTAW